jgi:hypothetical protein
MPRDLSFDSFDFVPRPTLKIAVSLQPLESNELIGLGVMMPFTLRMWELL